MAVQLKIVQGPGVGQVLPVPNGKPVTLGRSASASYAFDDPLLSRKHCAVESRGELTRIVDLQSRNGTFVNGQRVGAVLLHLGDRVKIGGLLFEVCPAGTAPSQPAPSMQGGRPQGVPLASPAAFLGVSTVSGNVAAPLASVCQGCNRTMGGSSGRDLKGRLLCPACFDRFDVQEDLIDGFKILERLEVNSFGVTYLAQQRLMDRVVILKTFPLGPEADKTAMHRFMREARTGGRLTHPSILELYDVNEQNGMLYLVTEYVEGDNLDTLLRERGGPLPPGDTLRAMYQIGEALAFAHEHTIVHRDVKPANVIVRRSDRRAKLQGFTLAKNLEGISVITADGETLGTPFYMPPEQVRSAKNVDARCDIYSWAATTYHCLSGRLPVEARSYGEFIEHVFHREAVPLRQVLPGAPAALAQLLDACLKREPAQRPGSMVEVLQALQPILRGL